MAAHYTNVTREEVEEVLTPQGFELITLEGTTELVYGKRVDRDGLQLTLRVYTGIVNEDSRGCGEDAMRVCIFWRMEDGQVKMAGGSKRVHRVQGWRNNLQNRIDTWNELLGPKCDKCGKLMVERKGKNGKFLGCVNFPTCRNTFNVDKPAHKPSKAEIRAEMEIREIEGSQI